MKVLKFPFSVVILSASLLLPARCPRAQEAQPSSATSQSVKLTVIVTDASKRSVDDIRKEELQLIDDKLTIAISLFAKDSRPVDYALVVDTSLSFKTQLASVVKAAKVLIDNNQSDDEAFVESFVDSEQVETPQEFTSDRNKLGAALDSLHAREGQSAVIDAVYAAVEHTAAQKAGTTERRRAVVLFTDGEDRTSRRKEDQLIKFIRENDVQVFVVGITRDLDKQGGRIRESPRDAAEALLKRMAEESGGRVFFPWDAQETAEAIEQIAHDLHSQYLIAYQPPSRPETKGFRKIKVKLTKGSGREKFSVITRPGYLIGAAGQKSVEKNSP